jgi:hypothetical protein
VIDNQALVKTTNSLQQSPRQRTGEFIEEHDLQKQDSCSGACRFGLDE